MKSCLYVSDLHGDTGKYRKLFDRVSHERPVAVFLGGDLLPSGMGRMFSEGYSQEDFLGDFLATELASVRAKLGDWYPRVFLILGNDDARAVESAVLAAAEGGIWHYAHMNRIEIGTYSVFGYANIPPSPFQLKDWEKFDVSRFVDPGCVSPLAGKRTVPVPEREIRFGSIAEDLERLTGEASMDRAVCLFHCPPYQSNLDRAALDGQTVDHVPIDVHIGSIAIQRFIERRQPWLTLHGHVHESARLTGSWRDKIGRTVCFNAAHDGPELALIRFDLDNPMDAERDLL